MNTYEIKNAEGKVVRKVTVDEQYIDMQVQEGETYELVEVHERPSRADSFQKHIDIFAKELETVGVGTKLQLNTKEAARNAIDLAAGRARIRHVSQGALIAEEYNQAKQQVRQWREAGSPIEDVPAMIAARAQSLNVTPDQAALDIEQASEDYEALFNATFSIRLEGKKAVTDAAPEDFQQVAQNYINQLDAL